MSFLLNIETATTNCSVSLSKEGETLVLKEDNNTNYSHAESLHVFINHVIEEAGIQFSDLSAVAVSKGPGSYTGLRIGVSAAKGIAYALNIPLISVSTLKALAYQLEIEDGLIILMLDARRMDVYSAVFDANHKELEKVRAEILEDHSFSQYLSNGKIYFIGNGVDKTKSLITHKNAHFIEGKFPSANEMSALAFEKYKKSDIEDVAYFEPFYLKDFIAIKSKKI